MSYDSTTKEIDGVGITITPLPFMMALKLKRKIMVLLGKRLAEILGSFDYDNSKSLKEQDFPLEKLSNILEGFFEEFSEKEMSILVDEFSRGVVIDGTNIQEDSAARDLIFAGRLGLFYKMVAFFVEVNYKDFFDLIRDLKKREKTN